jgi:hypothetical protein
MLRIITVCTASTDPQLLLAAIAGDALMPDPTSLNVKCRSMFRFSIWIRRTVLAEALTAGALLALVAGCASSVTGSGNGPQPARTTTVALLASSTANDQLWNFSLNIEAMTLTSSSGKTVSILNGPVQDEFIHVNGSAEPLATVSIPQGTYTSATATVTSANPACADQTPGFLNVNGALNEFEYWPDVTVNFSAPIAIGGTAMGLLLDLQASPSAPFSGLCNQNLTRTIAVTPTFKLTPVHYAAAPTDSTNGAVTGLMGLIAYVNPAQGNLRLQPAQDNNVSQAGNWQITFNGNTLYQGVSGSSQLQTGTLIDFDGALQADGSLAASRGWPKRPGHGPCSESEWVHYAPRGNGDLNAANSEWHGASSLDCRGIVDLYRRSCQLRSLP